MANLQVGSLGKNREIWRFPYKVSELVEAAERKAGYHQRRLLWWSNEKKKTEDEIKNKGITIEEFEVTGGSRSEVKLNAALQARLTECHGKFKFHLSSAEEFEVWTSVFKHENPDKILELGPDDVNYFKLGLSFDDNA